SVQVVGVEDRDVPAARERDSPVERVERVLVFLVMVADPRVGETVDDLGRAVGRAVVDDHQLEIVQALAEYAVDGGLDESRVVVRGHHHRDGRRGHGVENRVSLFLTVLGAPPLPVRPAAGSAIAVESRKMARPVSGYPESSAILAHSMILVRTWLASLLIQLLYS